MTWSRHITRARLREAAIVSAFFVVVAVFATWPMAREPLGGFPGFGNDTLGGIPSFGWIHDATLGEGDPALDTELQYPYGRRIPNEAVQPYDRAFSIVFGGFDQGLGAHNAQIFSSFVLSGLTIYLLARYLIRDRLASALAGFVFTFSPFHQALGLQYGALASIQWIPVYVLALLVALRSGSKRAAALAGAALALVACTSYYYAWFVAWFTVAVLMAFVARLAWRHRRDDGRLTDEAARRFMRTAVGRVALGGVVAAALFLPLALSSARSASEASVGQPGHPVSEAVRYSTRPWMLFLPPHDNPLLGDTTSDWQQRHLYDMPIYETSVYLGYVALALTGVALWRRRRAASEPGDPDGALTSPADEPERAQWARPLLLTGGLVSLLVMVGPYIPLSSDYWRRWSEPGSTPKLPSIGLVLFNLAPVFRFFSRAFVLVSLVLALFAAMGLARLLRRHGSTTARRVAIAGVAIVLVGCEYATAPPHVWYSDDPPAWVEAVKRLPSDAAIVEYPIAPAISPRSLYYMFWQTKHRRATLNPAERPEALVFAASVEAVDDPAIGQALRDQGFDYVVVHTALEPATRPPYQPPLPDDSLPIGTGEENPWLRVVERTPDAVIMEVLAEPVPSSGVTVSPGTGFGRPEPEGAGAVRWVEGDPATVDVFIWGRSASVAIELDLASFALARRVAISLDGRSRAEHTISAGGFSTIELELGLLEVGRHQVTIDSEPGPQSINATLGIPDFRSVSLRVLEPIAVRIDAGGPG